ncbi:ABC transporter family substrate-binding protein [Streptomyces lunaelactis]|nr:ABC transporter substrate-binding protein [Streptomyces lunaelactis]NUK02644.1 ABC transporter family substrate-binding protein [Streptomyces lunaelactis]NUK09520.1 ABC transporter family substrate-binding protein [Streptomyces lunaelactis]NUK16662.1 ABC transporter family substrate-binding protein [Streptomyces lunaelactis]NUK35654.1 ABC transporter family substrate-binding protein [Streptomyces lunaelactis]NUK51507.1 ABC transporter family substrate-binding protein [Streptomyces lunaelact
MSQVDAPRGRTCSRTLRSVALLTSGVLALPVLAGCSSGDDADTGSATAQDIAPTGRELVADGGTLRWAVDAMPSTLNAFQADADATTARIAGAVLPALFTLDRRGRPQRNPDYVESAGIVKREPKQVVLYKLNQKAVWSDGREIGAADFVAQWRALSGKDSAYWTARNSGYERIEKIEKGADDLQVKVTFNKPFADWQSLFTPLYPKEVTATPDSFNDGARSTLKVMAGPFQLAAVDRKAGTSTLVRNPRWWGQQAKLEKVVLTAVPREKRAAALAAGTLDLAEVDRRAVERIVLAARDKGAAGQPLAHGPGAALTPSAALKSWALANGSDGKKAEAAKKARAQTVAAVEKYTAEQNALRGFVVRKSLEPAYTQLALNGESGPLADGRVRRAVARALNRNELAEAVLTPLGLPANPPGSHLALAGQRAYTDNSGALGEQNTQEAQALLADAGWTPGGALKKPAPAKAGNEAGSGEQAEPGEQAEASKRAEPSRKSESKNRAREEAEHSASDEGLYIVDDDKPAGHGPGSGGSGTRILAPAPGAALQGVAPERRAESLGDDTANKPRTKAQENQGGAAGAYAPRGTAAPARVSGPLGKDGKPLTLRFVLPAGPGSEALRTVGDKIAKMLDRIGINTELIKVSDTSFFKDHIASGDYDLALYSWPATAYPATDARPIFAKPEPASDGSLLVEQNYTRVGTDYIDQLFAEAAAELNEDEARDLVRRADARIWAAAGSIPLYQRPELVAAKRQVVNAGAFGFAAPRYQDIGFKES